MKIAVTFLFYLSMAVMIGLSISILPDRKIPGGRLFLVSMSLNTIYSFGALMEYLSDTLSTKVLWRDVQQIGLLPTPVVYLLLGIEYSRYTWLLSKRSTYSVLLVPAVSLALIFTNHWTHWMRTGYTIQSNGYLVVHTTQFDTLLVALGDLMGIIGFFVMAASLLGMRHRQRLPIAMFMIATLCPIAFHQVRNAFHLLPGYDTSYTLGLIPAGLLFFWGVWRQRMFEIVPIARALLFQRMSDAVLILDRVGRIADANSAAFRMVVGDTSPPRTLIRRTVGDVLGDVHWTTDEARQLLSFRERWLEAESIVVRSNRGEVVGTILVMSDVSNRYEETQRLREEAKIDDLTGLVNRRTLERETKRIIDTVAPDAAAFFVVDIDNFKRINDTYGHATGDEMITKVASTLVRWAAADWVIGRLGGDEFAIAIPNSDAQTAAEAAQRLHQAVEETALFTPTGVHQVTISVGWSLITSDDMTFEDIYKEADRAMYSAKSAGKNRVVGPLDVNAAEESQ